MLKNTNTIFCLLFFYLNGIFSPVYACFSILVGKNATANNKVIIARNSDSKDARRSKNLKIYYQNTTDKLYIGLPYWDLEPDPTYDMPQVTTNRFGVSISATETIQSNRIVLTFDPPSLSGKGVSEPNIPAIVMPNATSAKNAVLILGKAIEEMGVNDGWGFGVLFGDSNEAWYLETLSGHQWVAIRIPENVYFVAANGPGQIQEYIPGKYQYLMSSYNNQNPIDFAAEHQLAHFINGIFNFRETYGDVQRNINRNSNYIRVAYAQYLLNPSTRKFNTKIIDAGLYPMFLKPERLISLDDIKIIQSSHYEGFAEYDPYLISYQDTEERQFYYPIANPRTSNAHITEIATPLEEVDPAIANVQYIALGMPPVTFYLPIYYGISKIPLALRGATNIADDNSLFWQFRKIQTLVFLNDPNKNIPYEFAERQSYVKKAYQTVEKIILEKQKTLEAIYQTERNVVLIDQFTQDLTDIIQKVNQNIISHFINKLDIENLYNLHSNAELNTWFTSVLREQDCFYRINKCDPASLSIKMPQDKYVDGPS